MRWTIVFFLLMTPVVSAEEVCVTVDASTWSDDHRLLIDETAYWLAFNVGGQNQYPTHTSGITEQLCFTDPTFDVPSVINETTILRHLTKTQPDMEAQEAQEIVRLKQVRQRLKGDIKAKLLLGEPLTAEEADLFLEAVQ